MYKRQVLCFSALVAWGEWINVHRTNAVTTSVISGPGIPRSTTEPPLPLSEVRSAEHTAAKFAAAIIDSAFVTNAYKQVIQQFVPSPYEQSALETSAANYSGGLWGEAAPSEVVSRAAIEGCMFSAGATPTSATVDIFVRWTSGVQQIADQWFTDSISLVLEGGRWVPTSIPENLPDIAYLFGDPPRSEYTSPAVPAGFAVCP